MTSFCNQLAIWRTRIWSPNRELAKIPTFAGNGWRKTKVRETGALGSSLAFRLVHAWGGCFLVKFQLLSTLGPNMRADDEGGRLNNEHIWVYMTWLLNMMTRLEHEKRYVAHLDMYTRHNGQLICLRYFGRKEATWFLVASIVDNNRFC